MDRSDSFSTTIPFSGFYYSLHSDVIDHEEERFFEHSNGSTLPSLLAEKFFDSCNYRDVYEAYGKEYVERFAEIMEIDIEFELMKSPREYNFQTDRLFGKISRDDFAKILWKVRGKKLKDKIKELFTSRSGFISYYSNNLSDWGRIATWDHNQVGTVLLVYQQMICKDIEDKIAGDIASDGLISEWLYDNAGDWGQWAVRVADFMINFRDNSHPYYPLPFIQ